MSVQLFGILNYTPDSFFDGNKNFSVTKAVLAAQQLLKDGASFIDIGAEATNPFVKPITSGEEIKRLLPILPELLQKFPGQISLDTYHPGTLAWALQHGPVILNDVSGLHDPAMIELAIKHNLKCIVGHLPPEARVIPVEAHNFKIDDFDLVVKQMRAQAEALQAAGLKKHQLILDPNIGFGKSMRLNWQLLSVANTIHDYPIMIGHSNKRFLGCDPQTGELLQDGQELRYTAKRNRQAAQIAIDTHASYLRVHDPALYSGLPSMRIRSVNPPRSSRF